MNPINDKLFGLLIVQCPVCKTTKVIIANELRDDFICSSCSGKHSLKKLFGDNNTKVLAFCECGNVIRGRTNCSAMSKIIEFNCKCGYPIDLFYNAKKKEYTNRGK